MSWLSTILDKPKKKNRKQNLHASNGLTRPILDVVEGFNDVVDVYEKPDDSAEVKERLTRGTPRHFKVSAIFVGGSPDDSVRIGHAGALIQGYSPAEDDTDAATEQRPLRVVKSPKVADSTKLSMDPGGNDMYIHLHNVSHIDSTLILTCDRSRNETKVPYKIIELCRVYTTTETLQYVALKSLQKDYSIGRRDCATFVRNFMEELVDKSVAALVPRLKGETDEQLSKRKEGIQRELKESIIVVEGSAESGEMSLRDYSA
jgi:hypothetical protein